MRQSEVVGEKLGRTGQRCVVDRTAIELRKGRVNVKDDGPQSCMGTVRQSSGL